MENLIDAAIGILGRAEARLETVSSNIANVTTPGYKARSSFAEQLNVSEAEVGGSGSLALMEFTQYGQGTLSISGNQFDVALSGMGMFQVMNEEVSFFVRDGRFSLDQDGVLVDTHGFQVADESGGAIRLDQGPVEILGDGTVLQNGLPQAKIGVFQATEGAQVSSVGGSLFSISEFEAASEVQVRQGMVEGSNVVLADEMIQMMSSVRYAEAGSQLVRTYDSLLGQAFSTFGQ